jgi:nitrogen fixation NifU-like protein
MRYPSLFRRGELPQTLAVYHRLVDREMGGTLSMNRDEMQPEPTRDDYGSMVIDHAVNPSNMGRLERYNGRARFTGPCGDTMEIWIEVKDGILERARFKSDGCLATIACGNMITELARDKKVLEAMEIGQSDVLDAMDGLPEGNEHCALLAATTLKLAFSDYLSRIEKPWRKYYERG